MLICLTDLIVWQYLLIEDAGDKKIKIVGQKLFYGMNKRKMFTSDVMLKHTKFIIEMEARNV